MKGYDKNTDWAEKFISKQYKKYFEMENVKLTFEKEAIENSKTGFEKKNRE